MSVAAGARLERQADIDIGYDYRFEHAWGRFERYVWLGFCILLGGGLLGIFGRGPLNEVTRTYADGTSIKYERVVRFKSPTLIQFNVPAENGLVTIQPDKAATEKLGLQQTFPQPSQSLGSAEVGPLEFKAQAADAQKIFVQLSMQPSSLGPVKSTYRINGQETVQIDQFIVP